MIETLSVRRSRRWARLLAATGITAVALGASVVHAGAAGSTHINILRAEPDSSGNLVVWISVKCPTSSSDYVYEEADQDLSTNDNAGHVYDGSFTCKGEWQTVKETIPVGTGTSHMDYNNDGEGDDNGGAFTTGVAAILATVGGDAPFTVQQRTIHVFN